jgi:D-alanyl-D-alanine carboxypeptidase/D-alanyl-D-alanine endopeptidase (penicillin-binding protein 7)
MKGFAVRADFLVTDAVFLATDGTRRALRVQKVRRIVAARPVLLPRAAVRRRPFVLAFPEYPLPLMLKTALGAALLALCSLAWSAPALQSAHALVIDDASGRVLYEKDAGVAAPIASMTKLLTAMVVLDARLDPDESLRIDASDLDTLKGTYSGVPVGAQFTRGTAIQLALMSSDNHAAHAIARTYPGGLQAFDAAMQRKIAALGLQGTTIEEPTGLSPHNRATARDMARIVKAAGGYPAIVEATSQPSRVVMVNGRPRTFHNTNRLVGQPGWDVSVSKTGFIQEAGRCVTMQMEAAGRKVLVVLMGARDNARRTVDALNIHRWLGGEGADAASTVVAKAAPRHAAKALGRGKGKHVLVAAHRGARRA